MTVVVGGESGRAVRTARRNADPRGGEAADVPNGDTGRAAVIGSESFEDARVCDRRGTSLGAVEVFALLLMEKLFIRGETGGEAEFTDPTLPVDNEGDIDRFGEVSERAVEVAW